MKLLSWNVNGLRAVLGKGDLQSLLAAQKPDMLCLQETKAQEDNVDAAVWPKGYSAHWCSAEKKGYSGTLLLTRNEPLAVNCGLGLAEHDREGRVITAEYPDFYLINVYTPNSKSDLSRLDYRTREWDRHFRELLLKLQEHKPVIVCGDMNCAHKEIDIARPKGNERSPGFTIEERQSFDGYIGAGFIDSFREFESGPGHYSWWSPRAGARRNNVGWRIDYFLVSPALRPRLKKAYILPEVQGSDHCPVGIELK